MAKSKKKHKKKPAGKKPITFRPPAYPFMDEILKKIENYEVNEAILQPDEFTKALQDNIIPPKQNNQPETAELELTIDRDGMEKIRQNFADLTAKREEIDKTMPSSIRPVFGRSIHYKIMDTYYGALYQLGIGHTREEAFAMNIIDTKDANNALLVNDELQKTHDDFMFGPEQFFNTIPCFGKGMSMVNSEASGQYWIWKIQSIDIEHQCYTVIIEFYIQTEEPEKDHIGYWQLCDHLILTVKALETDGQPALKLSIDMEKSYERSQIVRGINLKALDLTPDEQHHFKAFHMGRIDWETHVNETNLSIPANMASAILFLDNVVTINMCLAQHNIRTPSEKRRQRLPKELLQAVSKSPDNSNAKENNDRTFHIIDMITVLSSEKPRRPSAKSIAKYKTLIWQTRGHVRHYKNGKTVYIKPYTCRRKNIDTSNVSPKPATIRIRDNTDTFANPTNKQTEI